MFILWPRGILVHATDFVPKGGYDPIRGLCRFNFDTLGNLISGLLVSFDSVIVLFAFVTWTSKGCCFPRAIDSPARVHKKNCQRVLVLVLTIPPQVEIPTNHHCKISVGDSIRRSNDVTF